MTQDGKECGECGARPFEGHSPECPRRYTGGERPTPPDVPTPERPETFHHFYPGNVFMPVAEVKVRATPQGAVVKLGEANGKTVTTFLYAGQLRELAAVLVAAADYAEGQS